MTTFELHEDYRTATQEALQLLGLDRCDIGRATSFHELFVNLALDEKKIALAAVEVYRIFRSRGQTERILTAKDVYETMKSCMADLTVEECWVILLNQAGRIIRKTRIATGGIDTVAVDVRVILKEVIMASATAFVLVHNHPGGSLKPNREDDSLTTRLGQAAGIMNVRLIDHVIFTDNGFYSYNDEGRL